MRYEDEETAKIMLWIAIAVALIGFYVYLVNQSVSCDPDNLRTIDGWDICIED